MPNPPMRPVATLNGHAKVAITPIIVAVINGCQRFQIKYVLSQFFRL